MGIAAEHGHGAADPVAVDVGWERGNTAAVVRVAGGSIELHRRSGRANRIRAGCGRHAYVFGSAGLQPARRIDVGGPAAARPQIRLAGLRLALRPPHQRPVAGGGRGSRGARPPGTPAPLPWARRGRAGPGPPPAAGSLPQNPPPVGGTPGAQPLDAVVDLAVRGAVGTAYGRALLLLARGDDLKLGRVAGALADALRAGSAVAPFVWTLAAEALPTLLAGDVRDTHRLLAVASDAAALSGARSWSLHS